MTKKRKRRERSKPTQTSGNEAKHAIQATPNAVTAEDKASCLAQRLKKHRGTAANTPPPPIWKGTNHTGRPYLTPHDDPKAFEDCLNTSYKGFLYDPPSALPDWLHNQFDSSFRGMNDLFLYDTIQPGKKRLTRTSVTRTLVGEPGSTYKYLGLRLFSHPWVDVDEEGNAANNICAKSGSTLRKLGYSERVTTALIEMGRVNEYLTERSNEMLEKYVSPNVVPGGLVGSADYNLTLVNKMESTSIRRDLKKESVYGMGKVSVGWHRDSGLKDFSSIAVYQTLQGATSTKTRDEWGVALRAMDGGAGGPLTSVPALMLPLPSGSLYYMLDEFNHNHEHAVIAGSSGVRYSSTHRVAREGQGTWQYIRDKIDHFFISASQYDFNKGTSIDANNSSNMPAKEIREKFVSIVRAQQLLLNEVEFEWLRQWFVQGQKHCSLHHYWHRPIEKLCGWYQDLEKLSVGVVNFLRRLASSKSDDKTASEDLYDVFIECLTERSKLREAWKTRYNDPVFEEISTDERPISCPCFDRNRDFDFKRCSKLGQMPNQLEDLISQIRDWRSAFVEMNTASKQKVKFDSTHSNQKKQKKTKSGSLTRKEQKRVASNWEQLKKQM